jgi:hypothetical protein
LPAGVKALQQSALAGQQAAVPLQAHQRLRGAKRRGLASEGGLVDGAEVLARDRAFE